MNSSSSTSNPGTQTQPVDIQAPPGSNAPLSGPANPPAAPTDGSSNVGAAASAPVAYDNIVAPAVSVPKGGGAIRSIGEKFQANALTGTASTTVPIAVTPGRGGFGPSLQLSYDSGNGNSPFGFGWAISVAAITRKTSTGIPRYLDSQESDIFLLSGADELVPVLAADGTRYERQEASLGFRVHQYRPRVESSFAILERWSSLTNAADVHWRQLSPDNLLTIFGRDINSRIANPEAPGEIFSWLMSEMRDISGNVVMFTYKAENGDNVDMGLAHQIARGAPSDPTRTANRYLKSVQYGNQKPLLDASGLRPFSIDPTVDPQWLFQLVFDYGEHDINTPTPIEIRPWNYRDDAFSSYKSGFEIRTSRLCIRALMFHHFPNESDIGSNCLVSSTDLTFNTENPQQQFAPYRFLLSVQHNGYFGTASAGYIKRSRPSVDFDYSWPTLKDVLHEVTPESLVDMPAGLATPNTTAVDLFGEGISGFLSQIDGTWYYKRNITPIAAQSDPQDPQPTFMDAEQLELRPNAPLSPQPMLTDLTGDGSLSIVDTQHGVGGYYLSDEHGGWLPFTHFPEAANVTFDHPGVKMIDLNGDGSADMLVVDQNVWYRSRWKQGFAAPEVPPVIPGLGQTANGLLENDIGFMTFADISGDGLADLVDIRYSGVSYFPNLGYGKFGRRIYMDNSPVFDSYESYDPKNIIFADIDGSGTSDIIYMGPSSVKVYFNESGNGWSETLALNSPPMPSRGLSVQALDLFGSGTSCLVFSDPTLPPEQGSMRYIDLMGSQKPHLLTKMTNNFGTTTNITYSTSTKFYLEDRRDGKPWITRLAIPVHVVETIVNHDAISKDVFSTRYRYRHGFYDARDREFRGFGMVEQWDTSAYAALDRLHDPSNPMPSVLPPSKTKTWFHLGVSTDTAQVSKQYEHEYFQNTSFNGGVAALLPDTVLPDGIEDSEVHDAYRALKGHTLRVEVYADDSTSTSNSQEQVRSTLPYQIVESNYTAKKIQSKGGVAWRTGVFSLVERESITVQLERDLTVEPLMKHSLTLATNAFDQVLQVMKIAYGRNSTDSSLPAAQDVTKQSQSWVSLESHSYTNSINDPVNIPGRYVIPRKCETKSYQVTGLNLSSRLTLFATLTANNLSVITNAQELKYEATPSTSPGVQKRIFKWARILLRKDDLSALLPLGQLESRVTPGQGFDLALTDSLLDSSLKISSGPLVTDKTILTSQAPDGGGYVASSSLISTSLFPADQLDGYWIPTAQLYFSQSPTTPAAELAQAIAHFFTPVRFVYPMGSVTKAQYDTYDLSVQVTTDAIGNQTSVGDRLANGTISPGGFDYRVMQPRVISDANRNRTKCAYDALGVLVGKAVLGKPEESLGDSLDGFDPNLAESITLLFLQNPSVGGIGLLTTATTRTVYDLFAYSRSGTPSLTCTISRFTHGSATSEVQATVAYFDGFSRSIQSKIQVNPGPVASRDAQGNIILDSENDPVLTTTSSNPRWKSSGWVTYDNKGNTVCQYEPYYTDRAGFEFDVRVGATSIQFYDALSRQFASLLPNNSYSKIIWTPWTLTLYDSNDTVSTDPRTDPDVQNYMSQYFSGAPSFQTWYQSRATGQLGALEQQAAQKAAALANTPTTQYFDSLGRSFLQVSQVKTALAGHDLNNTTQPRYARFDVDIDGLKLAVRDATDRIVETFNYDMNKRAFRMASMDAGPRATLMNAMNKPIRQWDCMGRQFRFEYDATFRPIHTFVQGDSVPSTGTASEILVQLHIFGDSHPEAEQLNLKGGLFMTLEQSGSSSTESRDFKSNVVQTSRRIASTYTQTIDWGGVSALVPSNYSSLVDLNALSTAVGGLMQSEIFMANKSYDAQNNILTYTTPSATPATQNSYQLTYAVGVLTAVQCNVRAAIVSGSTDLLWTPYASQLDYDARGMRTKVVYGNGSQTIYLYDVSRQLVRQLSTRGSDVLQDLNFTYDPTFNVMSIQDNAQQTLFFRNQIIQPIKSFTYDSLSRLIGANGREHIGQQTGAPAPYSSNDSTSFGPQPGDANAFSQYQEMYVYDLTGNMTKMQHASSNAVQSSGSTSWTRNFLYQESSILEAGKFGNRLTSSAVSNTTEQYAYDAKGCCTYMPHLTGGTSTAGNMHWDMFGQFRQADLGGGGTAYFRYDESGRRARKVVEKGPNLIEERIYLDGFEIFRQHKSGQVALERETLHLMDGISRAAIVETRTIDTAGVDQSPAQLFRYQLSDHLGSSSIELDADAKILTYEEYSPYGSTTYQATNPGLELPKRYRFSGKERDEETGLAYFGARYYAPWLARWISTDPKGTDASFNTYEYASNNPIKFIDPNGKEPLSYMEKIKRMAEGMVEAGRPSNVVENIAKGIESEHMYGLKLEKEFGKAVISQVKHWSGPVTDFVTEGGPIEHKFIDFKKYVNEAGKFAPTEKLANRVKEGLRHGMKQFEALQDERLPKEMVDFFKGSEETVRGLGQKVVFSIEHGSEIRGQFREYIGQVAKDMAQGAQSTGREFEKLGIEVVRYKPSAALKGLVKGLRVLEVVGAGAFVVMDIVKISTSNDNTERWIAAADAAGNVLLFFVPAAGAVVIAGAMIAEHYHEKALEEAAAAGDAAKKQAAPSPVVKPQKPPETQKPKQDDNVQQEGSDGGSGNMKGFPCG